MLISTSVLWLRYMLFTTAVHSVTSRRLPSTFLRTTETFVSIRSLKTKSNSLFRMTMTNDAQQNMSKQPVLAKIVPSTSLDDCGARLRNGDLVAFPTETVYGLGCHALDPSAVAKVFAAKERPFTDPLIVHVTETSAAHSLWKAIECTNERRALQALCDHFWPGPLTLVAKAADHVPSIIMADTGYVACRSPSHPLARSLISKAGVPIAAPSANKFGHVSPTRAQHVYDDLQHEDVWIIEPEKKESTSNNDDTAVCNVGVESTVAKVTMTEDGVGNIVVLRQGAVAVGDFERVLRKAGLEDIFTVEAAIHKTTAEHVATVAPGQAIRHYAPHIPSFLLSPEGFECRELTEEEKSALSSVVLIDYGKRLSSWRPYSCAYRDLSASNDSAEAAKNVFDTLRWAEQVEGATRIIFPEISALGTQDALTLALKDRLTRAASGVVISTLR